MSGSSPSHSSSTSASTGMGGVAGGSSSATITAFTSDDNSFQFPTDLVTPQDRKDEALRLLKTELMAALHKEVKSLDEDSWKFAAPRSQIHLVSRPGGLLHNQTETAKRWHWGQLK